jgi:GntR family transcriptional regulator
MPAEYQRVYDGVAEKIAGGVDGYRPGARLPTIAELADEYSVSQTTIKTALTLLGRDGWTRGIQGKGTFVADRPPFGGAGSADRNV